MSLLADVRHLFAGEERDSLPMSMNDFIDYFNYLGATYPYQTLTGSTWSMEPGWEGLIGATYRRNGVVFACVLARLMLFSEARLTFRQLRSSGPGRLFGTPALSVFEKPWADGTTGDLLARAIVDVDLAGNFYVVRRSGGSLARLRPDWVELVIGTNGEAEEPTSIDAEVLGYIYYPGGKNSGETPVGLEANRVAHWYPTPDPTHPFRGVSWISTVLPEVKADGLATGHKAKFFENGATPNMIVTLDPTVKEEAFERWVSKFTKGNEGVRNAYRTVFLGGGATAQVVGTNLQQLDFKVTQGAGETRIAAAAGVPPIIVGLSEGLASATYSNYAQARRRFADMTVRPLWRNFCGSMAKLVAVPSGAELWYEDRDIPALREDAKDRAEIASLQAQTIKQLVDSGYKPDSVADAVIAEDWDRLEHTGLYSVQLQPPNPDTQTDPATDAGRALAALIAPHIRKEAATS